MIIWEKAKLKFRNHIILDDLSIKIADGESVGIYGRNGSGKTTLALALSGKIPVYENDGTIAPYLDSVFVPFHASHKIEHGHAPYRQQRWNGIDQELVPTVKKYLGDTWDKAWPIINKFGLGKHIDTFIISLSNGEMKKLELAKALASSPRTLILDNAYTGLDTTARELLGDMINELIDNGIQIISTGISKEDFSSNIKKFINLDEFSGHKYRCDQEKAIENLPVWENYQGNQIINTKHLDLQYGEKYILKDINWEVKSGERWALTGHNGSGKTSLLNMIFADNPKAYMYDIELFGQKKGSGESIWDIKRKIGFISPEMHQYLPLRQKCSDVVCSGIYDTEGLYRKPTGYDLDLAQRWLNALGIGTLSNRAFEELSTSEQRLVLFARTLIKNPPLLILDEPFQGLDQQNIEFLKTFLNNVAAKSNCTMIFVTHYSNEIPSCFTHHITLKDGSIIDKQ